jgi:predicted acylesterase/phospholipase RssA
MNKLSTALILTGSHAFISQEVAIIDNLISKRNLQLDPQKTWLTGYSGGAFTLAAINACFREKQPLDWDKDFKESVLFNLTNEKVFIKTHPSYWESIPLRKTVKEFLNKANLTQFSDFSFDTNILVYSTNKKKTIWAGNRTGKNHHVLLPDLLMATMAMPVIFPKYYINGDDDMPTGLPEGKFMDGSFDGVMKKFRKNVKKQIAFNDTFENMYIVSPERNATPPHISKELYKSLMPEERAIVDDFLENLSIEAFLKFLTKIKNANKGEKIAKKIYVSMPHINKETNLLDFNLQAEKYDQISNWAEKNPRDLAIELDGFLKLYGIS